MHPLLFCKGEIDMRETWVTAYGHSNYKISSSGNIKLALTDEVISNPHGVYGVVELDGEIVDIGTLLWQSFFTIVDDNHVEKRNIPTEWECNNLSTSEY